ncbi:MAG: hypothetical protein ABSG81_13730 [Acidimicrobiales bacterium]
MADGVRRARLATVVAAASVLGIAALAGACGARAAPSSIRTSSTSTPVTSTPVTSTPVTSTPVTSTPVTSGASSGSSDSADHVVPATFVGTWYVHGAVMTIDADGDGTQVVSGGSYGETDVLTFVVLDGGQTLVGTIRHISYVGSSGTVTDPDPADAQAVGDSFALVHTDPHVLDKAYRTSAMPAIDRLDSNPYWCGPGLSSVPETDRQRCGVG